MRSLHRNIRGSNASRLASTMYFNLFLPFLTVWVHVAIFYFVVHVLDSCFGTFKPFFLTLSGYHLSEASMHPSSLLVQWVELRSYRPQGRSLVLVFPSQSSSVVFRLPCESCQGTQGTHNPGQTADFPKLHCTTEPPRLHIVPLGTFCVRRLRVALLVQTHRGRLSVDRYERRLLS